MRGVSKAAAAGVCAVLRLWACEADTGEEGIINLSVTGEIRVHIRVTAKS